MELQEQLAGIRAKGLGLAAISYDSEAVLQSFAQRKGIAFPLLSDPESRIIRAYGLLNESMKPGPFFGVPHPGTLVLDRNGTVVSKFFEKEYQNRYTAAGILLREYGSAAGKPAVSIETKHLKLDASATPATVHVGQRVALLLDIQLPPRMHLYAPGVQGYIPVDWKPAASEAYTQHETDYPGARTLRLQAIGETVPVFEKRARLRAEITIAADAKVKPLLDAEGFLPVETSFRYQACDDKVCYTPQTVPVKLRLRYEPLDRERAPEPLRRK